MLYLVKKRRYPPGNCFCGNRTVHDCWLPLCLCLICLSSFYFSISAFICVGWYWYQKEGSSFWKNSFLKKYVPSTAVAAGMSAALLIPTALVLLEHGRSGGKITWMSILELFAPNPVMNNLFFNEYGLGLTFICLYAILAGLTQKAFRRNSLLFLLFGLFGIFSWLLNGALYARPKILIPFMPLIILHCARCFQTFKKYPLWPFAAIFPISLLWFSQKQFPWIIADALLLLSGIQMLFLSLLGQYMSKEYMESKKRPIYIVKEKGGF